MLYAKVTRGYKAGGINSYAVFPETRAFGPEYVTDYELGFKSNFDIGGIPTVFNVNGFYMDYSNIQRGAPDRNPATNTVGAIVLSTASAVIKGVEIEGMVKPIPEVELGFTYSHISSHYKSFVFDSSSGVHDCTSTSPSSPLVFAGADMTCRPLQYLSPNILSVHGSFQIPIPESAGELSLFLSYNWSDRQHTAPMSVEYYPDGSIMEPGEWLRSFGLLNASLNWNNALNSGLDISVFGTNILNKEYAISTAGVYQAKGDWSSIYGEPAMYGVNLRYRFGGSK